jgi:hypothetical protein
MLWKKYPKKLDKMTLTEAYNTLQGDEQSEIPWIVWLLENPASPIALPGNIDLAGHDCIHLLLKQGFTSTNEAYVVGFTMGNDQRTKWFHFQFFKIAVLFLYPPKYRLSYAEIQVLERGFRLGQRTQVKDLNKMSLEKWNNKTLEQIRLDLELQLTGDLSEALSTFLSNALTENLNTDLSSVLSSTIIKTTRGTISEAWEEVLKWPVKEARKPIGEDLSIALNWPSESLSTVWVETFGVTTNEPVSEIVSELTDELISNTEDTNSPINETLSEAWFTALSTIE